MKPKELIDAKTGKVVGASIMHIIEEADEEHFVKVFADDIKAAFDLTKTGHYVFQTVLHEYQPPKMAGGYSDTITLFSFDDALNSATIDISEKSFQRDLKERIRKAFLYHEAPNQYWVNSALFYGRSSCLYA